MAGDAEIEPVLEIVRHHLDELGAELGSRVEVTGRKRGSGQARQRRLRMRTNGQQAFGIFPHRFIILVSDFQSDQVGQRFFGLRVLAQQGGVNVARFFEPAALLQGYGFAEEHFFLIRILAQMLFESFQRLLGILQVEQTNSQPDLRFGVGRRDLQRFTEVGRGFIPAPEFFQAHGELEVGGAMMRIEHHQLLIGFGPLFELLQFVLDVPHGRIQGGRILAAIDGALQFLQRLLGPAFEVQRYGGSQRFRVTRTVARRFSYTVRRRLLAVGLGRCSTAYQRDAA